MTISLGDKSIGDGQKCFIIAEAGVNHNGDILLAKKLVDAAVTGGADAVKFQNFIAKDLIRPDAPKAAYQDRNIGTEKTQFDMLRELEMSERTTQELNDYSKARGIIFLSTAYELKSLEILERINVVAHKLASIDLVCHPLIQAIAGTGKPLILSTGMGTEAEIADAALAFTSAGGKAPNLILLQCNTNYPAKPQDQNLHAMKTLGKYVPIVGFSDHTAGDEISLAAIALGAKIIERHFTLDKNMPGPDHKSSMEPAEFTSFVRRARNIEQALGSSVKIPIGGELENMLGMRRSICASKNIEIGEIITMGSLTYKRPGDGLLPTNKNLNQIIGMRSKIFIPENTNIAFDMIEVEK